MNKVVLVGRLTKDPELRYTAGDGHAVTTITLAIDRRFSKTKETDFIPIVIWGKPAEATAKHVDKGKLIAISGRIQVRTYDAKDGTKRYVTEVVADEVEFIEWAEEKNLGAGFEDMQPVDNDDIPF